MEIFLVGLILVINFGISWWNAYVCGSIWEDSKIEGGFLRVLVWCAAIQSAVGFSSVYVIGLLGIVTAFADDMSKQDLAYLWQFVMSFWYLSVIFPVLGTGLLITIHSWMEAVRRKSVGSVAVAGWNTYAQVSNTASAFRNTGEAMGVVGDGLKALFSSKGGKDDAKAKVVLLGILLVIVALLAGVLTTTLLIKRYAARAPRVLGRAAA